MGHNADGEPGNEPVHRPVLWKEVLEYLSGAAGAGDGIFVDCTLGEGGHTELVLRAFEGARVLGVERDAEILERARERLRGYGKRVEFINDNFANVADHLAPYRGAVAGMVYDLGISSYHYDLSGRGFGFKNDEPLDMRLDRDGGLSARDIVNKYPENELTDIIFRYGEERWAKRIARTICDARGEKPVETTGELASLVLGAIPRKFHVKNIHPATRVFQALRIEVNDELSAISHSLISAVPFLAGGGRMMVVSFHSLEDRIVKNCFRGMARGCVCGKDPRDCRCAGPPLVKVLTKKPVTPSEDERALNRRSRSAKLRVCEKP